MSREVLSLLLSGASILLSFRCIWEAVGQPDLDAARRNVARAFVAICFAVAALVVLLLS